MTYLKTYPSFLRYKHTFMHTSTSTLFLLISASSYGDRIEFDLVELPNELSQGGVC